MKRKILPLLFAVAPLTLAHAGEEALTGASLQNTVAGRTVYINTPMGEVPIRYSKNGQRQRTYGACRPRWRVHNQGSRPLVGFRKQALHSLAELDVRGDALLHHASRQPERRPLAPGGWEERNCPARLSPATTNCLSFDAKRASSLKGKGSALNAVDQAAKRRSCLPSLTSSMIFAEKASRSEGWRLVMSP